MTDADVFADVAAEHGAFFAACAATAARDLGLFDALHDIPQTAVLAARLGVSAERLEVLLIALAAAANVRAHAVSGPTTWELIDRSIPTALPDVGLARIADVLRAGTPLATDHENSYQSYLHEHASRHADAFWAALDLPGGTLLDVGCGLGAYSEAWLARRGLNHAVACDLPDVLAAARSRVGDSHRRLRFLGGPLQAVGEPPPVQVALLANVLHLHGEQTCAALLQACARAIVPGGHLVIKEVHLSGANEGPAAGAYFGLTMLAYTRAGRCWTTDQLLQMVQEAGFGGVQTLLAPGGCEGQIAIIAWAS